MTRQRRTPIMPRRTATTFLLMMAAYYYWVGRSAIGDSVQALSPTSSTVSNAIWGVGRRRRRKAKTATTPTVPTMAPTEDPDDSSSSRRGRRKKRKNKNKKVRNKHPRDKSRTDDESIKVKRRRRSVKGEEASTRATATTIPSSNDRPAPRDKSRTDESRKIKRRRRSVKGEASSTRATAAIPSSSVRPKKKRRRKKVSKTQQLQQQQQQQQQGQSQLSRTAIESPKAVDASSVGTTQEPLESKRKKKRVKKRRKFKHQASQPGGERTTTDPKEDVRAAAQNLPSVRVMPITAEETPQVSTEQAIPVTPLPKKKKKRKVKRRRKSSSSFEEQKHTTGTEEQQVESLPNKTITASIGSLEEIGVGVVEQMKEAENEPPKSLLVAKDETSATGMASKDKEAADAVSASSAKEAGEGDAEKADDQIVKEGSTAQDQKVEVESTPTLSSSVLQTTAESLAKAEDSAKPKQPLTEEYKTEQIVDSQAISSETTDVSESVATTTNVTTLTEEASIQEGEVLYEAAYNVSEVLDEAAYNVSHEETIKGTEKPGAEYSRGLPNKDEGGIKEEQEEESSEEGTAESEDEDESKEKSEPLGGDIDPNVKGTEKPRAEYSRELPNDDEGGIKEEQKEESSEEESAESEDEDESEEKSEPLGGDINVTGTEKLGAKYSRESSNEGKGSVREEQEEESTEESTKSEDESEEKSEPIPNVTDTENLRAQYGRETLKADERGIKEEQEEESSEEELAESEDKDESEEKSDNGVIDDRKMQEQGKNDAKESEGDEQINEEEEDEEKTDGEKEAESVKHVHKSVSSQDATLRTDRDEDEDTDEPGEGDEEAQSSGSISTSLLTKSDDSALESMEGRTADVDVEATQDGDIKKKRVDAPEVMEEEEIDSGKIEAVFEKEVVDVGFDMHVSPPRTSTDGGSAAIRRQDLETTGLASAADHDNDITVSVVTWNLAEASPSEEDAKFMQRFRRFGDSRKKGSDLVLISGQECENIKPRRTEGHRSREFRRLMIKMLGKDYVPLAMHLLGGIQFGLFCKRDILGDMEHVSVADVTCGIGNVFHNKGAICAFLQMKARNAEKGDSDVKRAKSLRMLFVTAHMAAHVKNTEARDSDFWRIATELEALAPPRFLPPRKPESENNNGRSHLMDHMDRVFFCGDLNYRLDLPREMSEHSIDEMTELLNSDDPDLRRKGEAIRLDMLRHDQLLCSIAEERAFPGFAEAKINFNPTFKFDKETDDYDTSHKQRIPAWTDRILFKPDGTRCLEYDCVREARHSDHRPVYATFRVNMEGGELRKKKPRKKRSRGHEGSGRRSSVKKD